MISANFNLALRHEQTFDLTQINPALLTQASIQVGG
jgi:hypothetical protein